MYTRRKFIACSTACAAAAWVGQKAYAEPAWPPLGVQLYTVRRQAQTDLPQVLSAIRKIGYTTVETFAGEYKVTAADLRQTILASGLSVPSGHFSYGSFDKQFDYAKSLGLRYMVCSSVPESLGSSLDGFKQAADQYNAWGRKAASMGMRFAFHNHNSEFQVYGGKTGIEILLAHTDPHLVEWQMDCYWVAQAGSSPVEMLRKYSRRITTLHLKDRKAGFPTSLSPGKASQHFTEIGTGTLPWKQILELARKQEVRFMFVEQDTTELPPVESLRISYRNLRNFMS